MFLVLRTALTGIRSFLDPLLPRFNRKMSYTFNLNSLSNRNPLPFHSLTTFWRFFTIKILFLLGNNMVNITKFNENLRYVYRFPSQCVCVFLLTHLPSPDQRLKLILIELHCG